MTVYTEMLKMALERDADDADLNELVTRILSRRAQRSQGRPAGTVTRLADNLDYDLDLVRLCEHLGVPHSLTDADFSSSSRRQAEVRLAARVPALASLGEAAPDTSFDAIDRRKVFNDD